MSKRTKSVWEILNSPYVNKSEIRRLFGYSVQQSNRVFDLAQNIDIQRAGGIDKLIRTDKVTMRSVLKATGTDYSLLEKQIKNAAAVQERTASS